MLSRTTIPAVLATAAVFAAAAPAAQADSISYIKGGDVWLAAPDGSRQFQVTSTGAYSDASQADDGTIIALSGVRLHRLDRLGTVLANFDTPVSDTRPPGQRVFFGPYEPAISPDGTKVAYSYFHTSVSQQPGCRPPTCVTVDTEQGTGYSHADRQTAWSEPGLGRQSGWVHPAWLGNTRVMLSEPARALNVDVIADTVGDGVANALEWFSDNAVPKLGEGEMTRQGTKLAFVSGQSDEQLRIHRMTGAAPAIPETCFEFTGPTGGAFAEPTWAPDGVGLAWAEADGLWAAGVPDFAAGCTVEGAQQARLIVAGGSHPDWGPAAVPAGRPPSPAPQPQPQPQPRPQPQPGQPTVLQPGAGASLTVGGVRLGKALAKGFVVTVRGASGRVTLVATRGGRTVARGSATASAGATTAVRLRFSAAARRSLRRARQVRLQISGAGATTKVTLRR